MLAITLIFAAPLSRAEQPSYGPYPEQTYTECGPRHATAAVVLVHGGWNLGGSDDGGTAKQVCRALALRGVHVYSIGYRLANVRGQGYPAQLQDVQLALRWVRSLCRYSRVVLIGLSAGGYDAELATFLDTTVTWPPTDPSGEAALYPGISSKPDATALLSPFSDLTDPRLSPVAVRAITAGVGWSKANLSPAMVLAIASPLAHIKPDIAPTLVIHGTKDPLVPVEQSQMLFRQMEYLRGPLRLELTAGKHILGGLSAGGLARVLSLLGDCAIGTPGSICADESR